MNPEVAIVILNYNGWRDTVECLESLNDITYVNYDVIVVDNGSYDESLVKIRAYCKNGLRVDSKFVRHSDHQKTIRIAEYTHDETKEATRAGTRVRRLPAERPLVLIKNERNYGFAEGSNIGIRYALKAFDPDYVLLLNNDAVVDRDFLRELVDAASRDPRIGLVQPKVLRYADSKLDDAGVISDRFLTPAGRGFGEEDYGQYDEQTESGFFCATGTCLLIRKRLLSALAGECFDPYLFAYIEDVDLSWMARLLDYSVIYCPTSICYHKGGRTSGRWSPWKSYIQSRNRLRVMIKNYSFSVLAIVLPVWIIIKPFLVLAEAIYNMNIQYFNAFLRALCWNVVNLTSTLDRRRFIQSRRKISDKEVMGYMVRHSLEVEFMLKFAISAARSLKERHS